jgi:hypothetical protein
MKRWIGKLNRLIQRQRRYDERSITSQRQRRAYYSVQKSVVPTYLNLRQELEVFESNLSDDVVRSRLEEFLNMKNPYKVSVRESSVAGRGLFAEESFEPNQLVTLYPGTIYAPGDTGVFLTSLRNDYVLRRNDGYTLDGKPRGLSRLVFNDVVARDALNVDTSWCEDNSESFGLGHRVNTSSSPDAINLVYVEVEITRSMIDHNPDVIYQRLVNSRYSNESLSISPYRTIGLFTRSAVIPGEEFFVSYDFIASPSR